MLQVLPAHGVGAGRGCRGRGGERGGRRGGGERAPRRGGRAALRRATSAIQVLPYAVPRNITGGEARTDHRDKRPLGRYVVFGVKWPLFTTIFY